MQTLQFAYDCLAWQRSAGQVQGQSGFYEAQVPDTAQPPYEFMMDNNVFTVLAPQISLGNHDNIKKENIFNLLVYYFPFKVPNSTQFSAYNIDFISPVLKMSSTLCSQYPPIYNTWKACLISILHLSLIKAL